MGFIKSLIRKVLGIVPGPENPTELAVEQAAYSPQGQQHALSETSQPPVQIPVNQTPQTLAAAIAYVRMDEPKDFADQVTWHNVRCQLGKQYKDDALRELRRLLLAISSTSLTQTEDAIDNALVELGALAPVDWVLDRKHVKNHSDGSRSYRLIGHWARINPNGAFAITDLVHQTWLAQASANGTPFVTPP